MPGHGYRRGGEKLAGECRPQGVGPGRGEARNSRIASPGAEIAATAALPISNDGLTAPIVGGMSVSTTRLVVAVGEGEGPQLDQVRVSAQRARNE